MRADVDVHVLELPGRQEEVLAPLPALEPDDVGPEHPAEHRRADLDGQRAQVRPSGERRVREMEDPRLRHELGHLGTRVRW